MHIIKFIIFRVETFSSMCSVLALSIGSRVGLGNPSGPSPHLQFEAR